MIPQTKKSHPPNHHLAALLLCSTGLSLQASEVALDDFDHANHAATGRGHTLRLENRQIQTQLGWEFLTQITLVDELQDEN